MIIAFLRDFYLLFLPFLWKAGLRCGNLLLQWLKNPKLTEFVISISLSFAFLSAIFYFCLRYGTRVSKKQRHKRGSSFFEKVKNLPVFQVGYNRLNCRGRWNPEDIDAISEFESARSDVSVMPSTPSLPIERTAFRKRSQSFSGNANGRRPSVVAKENATATVDELEPPVAKETITGSHANESQEKLEFFDCPLPQLQPVCTIKAITLETVPEEEECSLESRAEGYGFFDRQQVTSSFERSLVPSLLAMHQITDTASKAASTAYDKSGHFSPSVEPAPNYKDYWNQSGLISFDSNSAPAVYEIRRRSCNVGNHTPPSWMDAPVPQPWQPPQRSYGRSSLNLEQPPPSRAPTPRNMRQVDGPPPGISSPSPENLFPFLDRASFRSNSISPVAVDQPWEPNLSANSFRSETKQRYSSFSFTAGFRTPSPENSEYRENIYSYEQRRESSTSTSTKHSRLRFYKDAIDID